MLQAVDSKGGPASGNIFAVPVETRQHTGHHKRFGIAAHCTTKTFSFSILFCPANKKKRKRVTGAQSSRIKEG